MFTNRHHLHRTILDSKKHSRRNVLAVLAMIASTGFAPGAEFASAQLEFFEKEVRPLFAKHCYKCHSVNAKRLEAGLLLDSRASQLRGGDSGPAIVPARPIKV